MTIRLFLLTICLLLFYCVKRKIYLKYCHRKKPDYHKKYRVMGIYLVAASERVVYKKSEPYNHVHFFSTVSIIKYLTPSSHLELSPSGVKPMNTNTTSICIHW